MLTLLIENKLLQITKKQLTTQLKFQQRLQATCTKRKTNLNTIRPQIALIHMQLEIFSSCQFGKDHKVLFKEIKMLAQGWKNAFLYITSWSVNRNSLWGQWFSNSNSNYKCAYTLTQNSHFYKYNPINIQSWYMQKLFILSLFIRSKGWKL